MERADTGARTAGEGPAPGPDDAPGRRYVTLLFADLSRSTELAGAMEAEDYAALLAALRGAYQDLITEHGGVVVRVQGDGLLAMFGHPQTREDDGRRAVDAALRLHRRVRELPHTLPAGYTLSLHTGIHSGMVLIGAGDIERGRFELLGPVPNIASRLSDAAAPHEILVSEETLGPASRFFDTGAPRSLQVKGRDAPILVYRVEGWSPLAARFEASTRHGSAPFVGRQPELQLLERALGEAMHGQPGSVAVAGAPGMGKTRLIECLLDRAAGRGWRVLRGYCESDLGAEPLQPFRHMLQALGDEGPLPEGTAEIVARLARAAEAEPLLLFGDDWQWADDASRQVLAALRRLAAGRLFIVLSTRSGGHDAGLDATAQTIALAPLTDAEATRMIADRLPGVDPFIAVEIARHAGGMPLFIDELCHSVARGGAGPRQLHAGAGWLNHLVESRVQDLPAAQAAVVRLAAVIGNVVPAWLLERLSGEPEGGPLVRGLAERDFLFPGERPGTLRFKHGITRDIIYQSVGLHERQALHRRIGEALQQGSAASAQAEALEALAYHFEAGGDAAQAAHYAELAGNRALSASALDRARAQYRAALAALDRLPLAAEGARRWVTILNRLGLVCVYDPSRSELALAQRAVELSERFGDAATTARVRHWVAYISYALGDTPASILHGERALAEATAASDASLAAQCVAMLGVAHTAAARYPRALELLEQSITGGRARSARRTDASLIFSLVCRGWVLGDRGQFAAAMESFDEALAVTGNVMHEIRATTQGWRSAVLLWQGHWSEACAAADESARIAEATRSLAQLSIARAIGGYARWMLQREPASLQAIVEATAWLAPRESGLYRSLNHGWLAEGLMHVGRRGEARHHAALALRRSRQRDLIGVAMSWRALARDAAAAGRHDAARRCLARAYETARQRDSAHETATTQLCDAQIALLREDRAQAVALLDAAMPAFEAMAMGWHLGEASQLRALLGSQAG